MPLSFRQRRESIRSVYINNLSYYHPFHIHVIQNLFQDLKEHYIRNNLYHLHISLFVILNTGERSMHCTIY